MTSSPDSDDTQSGAARTLLALVLGVVLDQLAVGSVVIGLVLTAYASTEADGPARPGAVVVGVLAVVMPFVSWKRHWSDTVSWLVLGPLALAVLAAFVWAAA